MASRYADGDWVVPRPVATLLGCSRPQATRIAASCVSVVPPLLERHIGPNASPSLPVFDGKDRSFAHSFRTGHQAGRRALGRLDQFAEPSGNGRYLRIPTRVASGPTPAIWSPIQSVMKLGFHR